MQSVSNNLIFFHARGCFFPIQFCLGIFSLRKKWLSIDTRKKLPVCKIARKQNTFYRNIYIYMHFCGSISAYYTLLREFLSARVEPKEENLSRSARFSEPRPRGHPWTWRYPWGVQKRSTRRHTHTQASSCTLSHPFLGKSRTIF